MYNHLTVCKQIIDFKLNCSCYIAILETTYLCVKKEFYLVSKYMLDICMHKQNLALHNLQELIYHQNQPTNQPIYSVNRVFYILVHSAFFAVLQFISQLLIHRVEIKIIEKKQKQNKKQRKRKKTASFSTLYLSSHVQLLSKIITSDKIAWNVCTPYWRILSTARWELLFVVITKKAKNNET